MHGFDVPRFVRDRTPDWQALEALLTTVEERGMGALSLDDARRFGVLYRSVSSDLIRARTELVDASVTDYLNALVARAYAQIYSGTQRRGKDLARFFLLGFPRLLRAEWRALALASALFFGGGFLGALAVAIDPAALAVMIPEQHQATSPSERVAREETKGGLDNGHQAAAFSSFLFTHNLQVSFLVFALGLTWGVGTISILFYNGIPLGALAMQYHQGGEGLFFWAWILPHGIPEITEILIAGTAGLILARGLCLPGRRPRRDALVAEAKTAGQLVVGGMPLLVVAGLIEGTISQMHEPAMPYAIKLLFAAVVGTGLYSWLLLAGRRRDSTAVRATRVDRPQASAPEP